MTNIQLNNFSINRMICIGVVSANILTKVRNY